MPGESETRPILALVHVPPLKRLLGRVAGLGFHREHIHSPHHANHR